MSSNKYREGNLRGAIMKKTVENLYPHSATLFRFCKEALEIHYDGNVKVIDQDVGAILGYDPADCSHWKKGKKNIRALATLRSIADHLRIDERLLVNIASGKVDLQEAVFEYRGYGNFSLRERPLESLKKEYFKNPAKWQTTSGMRSFEDLFDVNRPAVAELARQVLELANFSEAPIFVQEIFSLFPNINLCADRTLVTPIQVDNSEVPVKTCTIRYRDEEMRPYVRFLLVKELFKFLCSSEHRLTSNFVSDTPTPQEVIDVRSNVFAGLLLIPDHLLRRAVNNLDSSLDVVNQLTNVFWVSKALMNNRLRDYLENG